MDLAEEEDGGGGGGRGAWAEGVVEVIRRRGLGYQCRRERVEVRRVAAESDPSFRSD